jgi:hypothetical protein
MISLPLHISYALQPLDVACFKPFKTTFRKEIVTTIVRENYIEPYKITLVGWVDKALNLALTKNIYHVKVQRYRDLAT